jgi:hypothetical protein
MIIRIRNLDTRTSQFFGYRSIDLRSTENIALESHSNIDSSGMSSDDRISQVCSICPGIDLDPYTITSLIDTGYEFFLCGVIREGCELSVHQRYFSRYYRRSVPHRMLSEEVIIVFTRTSREYE